MSSIDTSQAIKLAEQVANRLAKIDGVTAIALGGSLARGVAHPNSDIDLGLYYNPDQPPLVKDLCQLAGELDDSHATNLITEYGEWGPWINGGGWLKINGYPVDWLYRNTKLVSKIIDDCLAGKTNCYYQPGHPHGFHDYMYLSELYYCRPLYDPQDVLLAFKENIKEYPPLLKQTIIQKFLWEADFSLKISIKAAKRSDVFYVTGCLFRSIACLVQVLFALNERYFINEKGSLKIANSFAIRPSNFEKIISTVMANPGNSTDELLASINSIEAIVGELDQIKERMEKLKSKADYVTFDPADYVDNPIALARIKAGITQEKLAERMKVTQAYISKIESQDKVTAKILQKVKIALQKK